MDNTAVRVRETAEIAYLEVAILMIAMSAAFVVVLKIFSNQ